MASLHQHLRKYTDVSKEWLLLYVPHPEKERGATTGRGGTPYWKASRADDPNKDQQASRPSQTSGRSASPPVGSPQIHGQAAPREYRQETRGLRRSPQQAPHTQTSGRSASPLVGSAQIHGQAAPREYRQETRGRRRSPPPPPQQAPHTQTSGRSVSPPGRSSQTPHGYAAPSEKHKETRWRRRSPPPERLFTGAGQARRAPGVPRHRTQWFSRGGGNTSRAPCSDSPLDRRVYAGSRKRKQPGSSDPTSTYARKRLCPVAGCGCRFGKVKWHVYSHLPHCFRPLSGE